MPDLILRRALAVGQHAIAIARRFGSDATYVAVDQGGHPIVVLRTDRCAYPTIETARRKAVTAASLRMPTQLVSNLVNQDPVIARAIAGSLDMLAVPGGFPLVHEGVCVGGMGVAGARYDEDHATLEQAIGLAMVPASPGEKGSAT